VTDLDALKARYPITRAWRDLGLRGVPGRCVPSPFREDRNPSFSIWRPPDGTERFKDHGTNESGDVLDFVRLARGCDTKGAIEFIERQLGIARPQRPPAPVNKAASRIPPLRRGTDAELRELSERRGFSIEALKLAEQQGFLFFAELWGLSTWCVTDQRRQLHEFRRVDGAKWPAYGRLPERKAHCIGTGKAWPIGTVESRPFPKIAWVEGPPDFLAAHHFLLAEGKTHAVAPVGVLGASNQRLAPEALAQFRSKQVLLFPHLDVAGRKAARTWAQQLKDAGVGRVTAFDLSGLVLVDGTAGKDLCDLLRIDPDCWGRETKFRGDILP
jgi:hypothetical protein